MHWIFNMFSFSCSVKPTCFARNLDWLYTWKSTWFAFRPSEYTHHRIEFPTQLMFLFICRKLSLYIWKCKHCSKIQNYSHQIVRIFHHSLIHVQCFSIVKRSEIELPLEPNLSNHFDDIYDWTYHVYLIFDNAFREK